jgi:hypothetical protein
VLMKVIALMVRIATCCELLGSLAISENIRSREPTHLMKLSIFVDTEKL